MNAAEKFKHYLESVPKSEYSGTRKQIAKKCYVSNSTISFWISGRVKIPPLAKPIIEEIANRKIFEV